MIYQTISSLRTLLLRNLKRGYFKVILLSILFLGAILFQTLYGSWLQSSLAQNLRAIDSSKTPFFDTMVLLQPETDLVLFSSYPPFRKNNNISVWPYSVIIEKQAFKTVGNGPKGDIDLLSIDDLTPFYPDNLQGRLPENESEILLPLSYAETANAFINQEISLSQKWVSGEYIEAVSVKMTIVGIYNDTELLFKPAFVHRSTASRLLGTDKPNCILIQIVDKERGNISVDALVAYMKEVYPKDHIISSLTLNEMSSSLIQQRNTSSSSLMILFHLFQFISIQTVILLDFQKRRSEIASLKCIGISFYQLIIIYFFEHAIPYCLGAMAAYLTFWGALSYLPWLDTLELGSILQSASQASLISLVLLLGSLCFPLLTSHIANINQLLFSRRIPIRTIFINHLDKPSRDLINREQNENVRLIQLPSGYDADGMMILKSVGNMVKKGETIAARESWFGYEMIEWQAWCDGEIIEINRNGIIAIRPSINNTPFYQYQLPHSEEKASKSTIETRLYDESSTNNEVNSYAKIRKKLCDMFGLVSPLTKGKHLVIITILLASLTTVAYFMVPWRSADNVEFITQELTLASLRNVVKATGRINSQYISEVINTSIGKIEEINFAEGDYVEQGQTLVKLSNTNLNSNLQQARYELSKATLLYEQSRQGHSNGAGDVQLAMMKILEFETELEMIRKTLSRSQIRATDIGYVTDVHVQVDDFVSANNLLFSIHYLGKENSKESGVLLQQAKANLSLQDNNLSKLKIYAPYDGQIDNILVALNDIVDNYTPLLGMRHLSEQGQNHAVNLQLEQAKLMLKEAERNLNNLQVLAPLTGRITEINLLPGDSVSKAASFGLISDDRQMIVRVDVPQSYINGVAVGNKAEIMIANSAKNYNGVVSSVTRQGQQNSNNYLVTYSVDISIENDGSLYAGMSAIVDITSSDATFRSVSSLRGILYNEVSKSISPQVEGELVELLAKNDDWVLQGQVIAIVKNDVLESVYYQALAALYAIEVELIKAPFYAVVDNIAIKPGDTVKQGQLLMELGSDSLLAEYTQALMAYDNLLNYTIGNTEIYTPSQGVIETLFVNKGDYFVEGQLLAEVSFKELELKEQSLHLSLMQARSELETLIQNPEASELANLRFAMEQAAAKLEACEEQVNSLTIRALTSGYIFVRHMPIKGEYLHDK